MGADVVEHDDVAGTQLANEHLLDKGLDHIRVSSAFQVTVARMPRTSSAPIIVV